MWKLAIDATLEEEYKKKLLPGLIKRVKAWKRELELQHCIAGSELNCCQIGMRCNLSKLAYWKSC